MYLNEFLESKIQTYEAEIKMLEAAIAAMPEGTIHVSMSGKYPTWRVHYPDGSRIYLSQDQLELAQKLGQKLYYEAKLKDLKKEVAACRKYLSCKGSSESCEAALIKNSSPELKRLMGLDTKTISEKAAAWENAPYKKYEEYPENLKYPTLKSDEKVRSKFEAETARDLFLLRIPYKYEKVIKLGNELLVPDFIALDIRVLREIPIELFGMMDKPEYRTRHDQKLEIYIKNGYYPGVNMLTFYESSSSPSNPVAVKQALTDFFFINPPILF